MPHAGLDDYQHFTYPADPALRATGPFVPPSWPTGPEGSLIGGPDGPFAPGPLTWSTLANGMPVLNSRPAAPVAIFLDFDGDGSNLPYDTNGNGAVFDATEQGVIAECYRQISIFYSMFDANVTTIQPPASTPTVWQLISPSISGGYAYVGAFPNSQPRGFNQASDARTRISGIAHEIGHNIALGHQSDYNSLGVKTAEYSSGPDALNAPIMGVDFAQNVRRFYLGHPSGSNTNLQDDFALIAGEIDNYQPAGGDGFVADDHTGTPTEMLAQDGYFIGWGTIERLSDTDTFTFTTAAAGRWGVYGNALTPSSLDVKYEIFDSTGKRVATADSALNDQTLALDLAAGTYTIVVSGHGDYGDQGVYHLSARPLPAGWTGQDIGTVIAGGHAGMDPATGTWYVAGSGDALTDTSNAFRFTYVPLAGNGSITARVTSVENTNANAKVGVMVRETTATNSRFAAMMLTPTAGIWLARTSTGGSAATTTNGTGAPRWVRVTRSGNTLTGQTSPDGVTWTTVNSATIAMGTNVLIGIAVTSNSTAQVNSLNESTLTNVSTTGTTGTPPPTVNGLAAPEGVAPSLGTGTDVVLNWSAVAGAIGYAIDRSPDNVTWTQIAAVAGAATTTYTSAGLGGAQRWFYRVAATDSSSRSVPSAVVSIVNRPAAVTSFRTSSVSQSTIVLDWIETSGESGYRIERSADGTTWSTLATIAANRNGYANAGLAAGVVYQYRVIPTSPNGDGPASTALTESSRLAAVGGLTRTALTATSASFSWNPVAGATGYRVDRSTDGGSTWSQVTTTAGDTAVTLDGLAAAAEGMYRVAATNAYSESSSYSTALVATPPATALPTPWTSSDVGTVVGTGTANVSGSVWTVIGSGTTITGTSDNGHFISQPLYGNGSVVARVASIEATGNTRQAGIAIRESLAAHARSVFLTLAPQPPGSSTPHRLNFTRRATAGSTPTVTTVDNVVVPEWLRLTRSGNTFTAERSEDGFTWTTVGSATVTMPSTAFAGLFVAAGSTSVMVSASFDNVAVTSLSPPAFVTGSTPTAVASGPVAAVDFAFNRAMDTTSFDPAADLGGFTGPTGNDLRPLVTGFSWLNNQTLRLNFAGQTVAGLYSIALAPTVLTATGTALDGDRDGVPGEAGDGFTATVRIGAAADGFDYAVHATAADATWNIAPTTPGVVAVAALGNLNDGTASIDLGTNSFRFYGTSYTGAAQLFVSANGLITLGGALAAGSNGDLTTTPGICTIAPLWDNLTTNRNTATDDQVLFQFRDETGDGVADKLVVAWRNVHYAGGSNGTDDGITFQAVLSLNTGAASGDVLFNYTDLTETASGNQNNGAAATVGIKDVGIQGANRQLVGLNGSAVATVASGRAVRLFVNTAPAADAGGPYSLGASATVTLNGSGTDGDGTGVSSTLIWDLDGDGIFGETDAGATRGIETGSAPQFSAAGLVGPATFPVRLRAVDQYGRVSAESATTVAIPAAPRVAAVEVDDNTGQRSRVRSLTVRFNTVVALPQDIASAFQLTGPGGPVSFTATAQHTATETVATLSFAALADGNYTLTVLSSLVADALGQALDGDGDGQAGGDAVSAFHSLFGDANGDRTVNAFDFAQFRTAFGTALGDPSYRAYLDFDGDGAINAFDFGRFRTNFGVSLP